MIIWKRIKRVRRRARTVGSSPEVSSAAAKEHDHEVAETVGVSCEARAIATDERLELYVTASVKGAVASSSKQSADDDEYVSARRRLLGQMRSECESEAEFEVVKTQEHWTEVGRPSSDEELLQVANQQHFQRLVEHVPIWPYRRRRGMSSYKSSFFVNYGDDLEVGEKIAEGGQAEIFKAAICGKDDYVVKVLKPGYDLAELERQWNIRSGYTGFFYKKSAYTSNCCFMESGTLLRDGRFAFVMPRYLGDLRKLIDRNMEANNGQGPPFPSAQALTMIRKIAKGMYHLHQKDILHRDLKASNVLIGSEEGVSEDGVPNQFINIADFESSIGVLGTGFWRPPEVLQALKNRALGPNIWTKAGDVYSYAMTCYEILTGRIPFGDLAVTPDNFDFVIRGARPLLPDYVDHTVRELLERCWHSDPSRRPWFEELVVDWN